MPDQTRTVVVNTTPIIALSLIGKLDPLRQLYGEAVIPPARQIPGQNFWHSSLAVQSSFPYNV